MTTVTLSNLTADKVTVVLPSGETIVASSAGVSVSTAPEVNNVVAQSPVAPPVAAPAPVAACAPAASAPAPAAVVIAAPEPAAPSAVLVGIQQ